MLRHRDTRRDVDGETDIQTGRQTVRRRLERETKTNLKQINYETKTRKLQKGLKKCKNKNKNIRLIIQNKNNYKTKTILRNQNS